VPGRRVSKTAAQDGETGTLPIARGGPTTAPPVVADRYEIERELGRAGWARLVAFDRKLGRKWRSRCSPREHTARRRCAASSRGAGGRGAQSPQHPRRARHRDLAGQPYIVSELLEGETLASACGRTASARGATSLALHLAQGLCAAHEKGVIHRDLKRRTLHHQRGR